MSQTERITIHMRANWINPKQALDLYGCFRLASRVNEITKKYTVMRRWLELPNGKKVMQYKIKGKI